MNTLRPIRLKLAWDRFPKGHSFTEMPAGQAQMLVQRGLAEYMDEQVTRAPVDRMMRPARGQRQKAQA